MFFDALNTTSCAMLNITGMTKLETAIQNNASSVEPERITFGRPDYLEEMHSLHPRVLDRNVLTSFSFTRNSTDALVLSTTCKNHSAVEYGSHVIHTSRNQNADCCWLSISLENFTTYMIRFAILPSFSTTIGMKIARNVLTGVVRKGYTAHNRMRSIDSTRRGEKQRRIL